MVDAERRAAIAAQALAVLADPTLAPLFGPGSQAEIGVGGRVRLPDGREVEIFGQIDRMAVLPDAVLLADFKTGRPRPAAETRLPLMWPSWRSTGPRSRRCIPAKPCNAS